jgi:Pyridoxamine 5'-phosphate oxidase
MFSSDEVWRELTRASFAVISYVTPAGEPRSSGVVYAIKGRRMYVATAVDSWKARHIAAGGEVAVTVPVRRGGPLSLLLPIPPATISFHATATVYDAGSLDGETHGRLASLVPASRRARCRLIEICPVGQFVTYGLGVSLTQMRDPAVSGRRLPVRLERPGPLSGM